MTMTTDAQRILLEMRARAHAANACSAHDYINLLELDHQEVEDLLVFLINMDPGLPDDEPGEKLFWHILFTLFICTQPAIARKFPELTMELDT